MKMRKLFAGLAAAATLLGGLAFGAAPASAAEGTPAAAAATTGNTITVTATDANQFKYTAEPTNHPNVYRTFKYVRLADYKTTTTQVDGHDQSVTYLTTNGDAQVQSKVLAALKSAGIVDKNVTALSPVDPFTWLGNQKLTGDGAYTAQQWKDFVNALAGKTQGVDGLALNAFDTANTYTFDETQKTLTFSFETPGLYLIVDQDGDYVATDTPSANCDTTYHQIAPIMVGTKLNSPDTLANSTGSVTVELGTGKVEQKQTSTPNCTTDSIIQFKKTDAQGNPLKDAQFEIKSGQTALSFKWNTTENRYDYVAAGTEGATTTLTSDADGLVKLYGLPQGTYTIAETQTPNGYISQEGNQSFLPTFTLTVTQTGTNMSYTFSRTDTDDPKHLVTVPADGQTATVVNVKSVSELPKTGAAGTAIFSVIAVLIAGAAVTVYLRSHATKRQLMA